MNGMIELNLINFPVNTKMKLTEWVTNVVLDKQKNRTQLKSREQLEQNENGSVKDLKTTFIRNQTGVFEDP